MVRNFPYPIALDLVYFYQNISFSFFDFLLSWVDNFAHFPLGRNLVFVAYFETKPNPALKGCSYDRLP